MLKQISSLLLLICTVQIPIVLTVCCPLVHTVFAQLTNQCTFKTVEVSAVHMDSLLQLQNQSVAAYYSYGIPFAVIMYGV